MDPSLTRHRRSAAAGRAAGRVDGNVPWLALWKGCFELGYLPYRACHPRKPTGLGARGTQADGPSAPNTSLFRA